MFFAGRSVSEPSSCSAYCMNTRFHTSTNRSVSSPGRSLSEPNASPGRSRSQSRDRTAPSARTAGVVLAPKLDDPLARNADGEPALDRLLVGPEPQFLVPAENARPDPFQSEPKPSIERSYAYSAAPC